LVARLGCRRRLHQECRTGGDDFSACCLDDKRAAGIFGDLEQGFAALHFDGALGLGEIHPDPGGRVQRQASAVLKHHGSLFTDAGVVRVPGSPGAKHQHARHQHQSNRQT